MSTDDKKIDILKMEYTQACNKLLYLDDQANKYVSYILTAVAALAAFLALLIKDGSISNLIAFSLLISAGTLIIGLLIIMTLHHTVQCFRLGGYIEFLETEINSEVGCGLLKWESVVAPKYIHKHITTSLIYSIMGLVFLMLLFGAAYVSTLYIFPRWPIITVITFAVIILEIVAGIDYICKARFVHEKIYALLKQQGGAVEENGAKTE